METSDYGEGDSFKAIALQQLDAVIKLGNVEYRGGFYTHIVMKDGSEKEVYVPDTRETYSNAVYELALLTLPKFDEQMTEKWNKYNETKDRLIQEFVKKSCVDEEVILGEAFYEDPKDKILLETYKLKNLKLHHYLLKELSMLFARKNYFSMTGYMD